jgi:hypothetical protein
MTFIMSDRHLHHATKPELLRHRIDWLGALTNNQIEVGTRHSRVARCKP